MKKFAVACLFLILGCGAPKSPGLYIREGSPRLTLSGPRTVNTNQVFLLRGTLKGEQAALPFGGLIGIEIKANGIVMGRSVSTLQSRFMSIQMKLTPDFYLTFSPRRPRDGILDFEEVDPIGAFPDINPNEDDFDVSVKVEVMIAEMEINYKNEVVPIKTVARGEWKLRLSCTDLLCGPY